MIELRGNMMDDDFDRDLTGFTSEMQEVILHQELRKLEAQSVSKLIFKNRNLILVGESKPLAVLPLEVVNSTAWKFIEQREMLVAGLVNGKVLKLIVKL